MRPFLSVAVVGTVMATGSIVAADRIEVVSESQLVTYWIPAPDAPKVLAGYPSAAVDGSQDVCISLGFLIAPDGRTSEFFEMDSWSSTAGGRRPKREQIEPFVQMAAAVVSRWYFIPAGERIQPVFTSATFGFDGSKTQGADAIRQHCAIPNLQAFVDKARARDRTHALGSSSYERLMSASWSCSAQSSACVLARGDR